MRFGSPLLPSLGCLTPSQRANILQPHTPALSAVHTYNNALPMLPLTASEEEVNFRDRIRPSATRIHYAIAT
ncbi:hypothetical protein PTI98_005839 [Pleurotus ostreatus]|nr:hypothetical protein PTI98_005839 [Pleurotus ostreatus]